MTISTTTPPPAAIAATIPLTVAATAFAKEIAILAAAFAVTAAAFALGVGAGVGGAVGVAGLHGKKNTILQSAKLLVSVREIFLNDEHDVEYSNSVYEQYLENIMDIEKGLVELRLQADVASGKEKKELKAKIKSAEESVQAMKIARKSMLKFASSFEIGLSQNKLNN